MQLQIYKDHGAEYAVANGLKCSCKYMKSTGLNVQSQIHKYFRTE